MLDVKGSFVIHEEEACIEQALLGDSHAFSWLVDAYKDIVFFICYRFLGNANDAEDAAQESFFRAFVHLKNYDRQRSFKNWLLSIASHYCIDCLRRKKFTSVDLDLLPANALNDRDAPDPERELERLEQEALLQTVLNELAPKDKAIVILKYWSELSIGEIAQAVNLTESAVKSRLFRARAQMAQRLVQETEEKKEREGYAEDTKYPKPIRL